MGKGYLKKDKLTENYSYENYKNIPDIKGHFQTRCDAGQDEIMGWFMGTRGENAEVFSKFINETVNIITNRRKSFHPEDPSSITFEKKMSKGYLSSMQSLSDNFYRLITFLNRYSVPFYSMRYQGHMLWDSTMPSMIGYFAGMLQNSNNVSTQASEATILLEKMVTKDICDMIAYGSTLEDIKNNIIPWGHITCDGSVANLEAMWTARELKFMAVGIKQAILTEDKWKKAININVTLPNGTEKKLVDLNNWVLLNLTCDEVLRIPERIAQAVYEPKTPEEKTKVIGKVWGTFTSKYSLNALGILEVSSSYLYPMGIKSPAVLVPSSKHYSWPKGTSILGLGKNRDDNIEASGLINVFVDENARMDTSLLRQKLERCVKLKKPVLMVVAVIGSTEEGAVDPLDEILEIRNEFRKKYNFDFNIHCDAAWGGYVTSAIRKDYDINWPETDASNNVLNNPFIEDVSEVHLSDHVIKQLKHIRYSDSITIDPHKMGYVPYPAGTISYRNKDIINLVTYSAPYIGGGDALSALGQSGIEGSRPGAAASAIFLSHSVIRPSAKGHGKIINQSMKNAAEFLKLIRKMGEGYENEFVIVPLPKDSELPDMNIVDYAFNFVDKNGKLNDEIDKYNDFNKRIFNYHNVNPGQNVEDFKLLITMTTFEEKDYGIKFIEALKSRLKLAKESEDIGLNYLRSVVMDPWVAETKEKDLSSNFFEDVIIPTLRETVIKCVQEMRE